MRATLITLCFVYADDFHINLLKFVAGHGTVVKPVSINIVFGCKQAQQYSRTHHLGFIRAVSLSAQNAESHCSHVHITLTVEHLQFSCILSVWVTARFYVLFKSLNVTKTINFSLHISVFWKATNSFNATGHHACSPTLPKSLVIPLTSSKKFWPKISVAHFTKWFQSIFTVGGWRTYPFNVPLLAPAYIPTQSCKRVSFWSLNPSRARNHKPDIYFWSPIHVWKPTLPRVLRYAQLRSNKICCVQVWLQQVHGLSHRK